MKVLVFALSFLCALSAASAQDDIQHHPAPRPRTAMDDCLGRLKGPHDFERLQLTGFDEAARKQVGEELAGAKVCQAIVDRSGDPCEALTGIGKNTADPDKRIEGNMIGRCRASVRFARFYQEALHASPEQKSFPACLEYFKHVPIIEVGSGFNAVCGDIARYIQHREDKFCDPRVDPYVKDQAKWGAFCKIVGGIYLRGSSSDCAYFPEPDRCAAMATQVRAFQLERGDACAATLEGGVCRGYIPVTDKSVSRCKISWLQLSRDYCQALVATGVFDKAGKSKRAPSEDK